MKTSKILITTLLTLLLSSCSVEGEDISGVWFTNGALGKMKIEVKPSKGTFVGYLLEYEKNGALVPGGIEKKHLIFNELRFKNEIYQGGSFLQSPQSSSPCELKLRYDTDKKMVMKAAYKCDGVNRLEYWKRDKYPNKPEVKSRVSTISLDQLLKANPNNKDN